MTSTTYSPTNSIYTNALVSSQVVTLLNAANMAGTAGTWADYTDGTTTMSITFTPINVNNKLLILGLLTANVVSATTGVFAKLVQDGTDIVVGDLAGSRRRSFFRLASSGTTSVMHNMGFSAMVTAGTTSSTTIKLQIMPVVTGTSYINRAAVDTNSSTFYRGISQLTILEFSN